MEWGGKRSIGHNAHLRNDSLSLSLSLGRSFTFRHQHTEATITSLHATSMTLTQKWTPPITFTHHFFKVSENDSYINVKWVHKREKENVIDDANPSDRQSYPINNREVDHPKGHLLYSQENAQTEESKDNMWPLY